MDNPYVISLLMAGAISGVLAFFAWRHRGSPGAIPLTLLLMAVAVWQVAYAFELGGAERSTKILWAKVGYLGIATVPTAWLAVTLQFTGRGQWLTRRNMAFLAIVPLVTLLLAWSNESHRLIWSDIRLGTGDSFSVAEFVHGAWFWVYGGYSYLLLILGLVFLADGIFHSSRLYWKQATALFVSALVPWGTNWSFAVGLTPVAHLNLTPLAFVVSGLALAWALLRVRLLDIAPVARKAIFENMSNGVLVLDALNRVADFNPAAHRIIDRSDAQAIGLPIAEVWPDVPELVQRPADSASEQVEFPLVQGGELRTYNLIASPLFDSHSSLAGRLILFHDITESKRAERERERLFDEVSASRERLRALSNQLVELQEAERRHLARELHDEIGQVLTGLQLTLESGRRLASDGARNKLDEAQELVNNLVERVRELSLDLRPAMLDDLGLVPALTWYFERYTSQTDVAVDFAHTEVGGRFRPEVETATFRIAQEALTNVARHAGVRKATVGLWTRSSTLGVRVEDRGVGFDPDGALAGGVSNGLLGMRERAELLGGRFTVKSAPGSGSVVTAQFPLGG